MFGLRVGIEGIEPGLFLEFRGFLIREFSICLFLFFIQLFFIRKWYWLVMRTSQPIRPFLHIVLALHEQDFAPVILIQLVKVMYVMSPRDVHPRMVQMRRHMRKMLHDIRRPELLLGIQMYQRRMIQHELRDILQHPLITIPIPRHHRSTNILPAKLLPFLLYRRLSSPLLRPGPRCRVRVVVRETA